MLYENYNLLCDKQRPPEGDQLLATQLDAWNGVWLAIDRNSRPALLFSNEDRAELSDLKLHLVDAAFSKQSHLIDSLGSKTSGIFTIVRLNDNDPDLAHLFLRLLEVAFLELRTDFSNRSIRQEIVKLADLFRRAESELTDVIGLWGELHIIQTSGQIERAARSWCTNTSAKFDFVSPRFSLEVKSTLKARRVHRFSLDQLRPAAAQPHFIASLLLLEKPDGQVVGSLVDSISDQISDSQLKGTFLKQCLLKAGQSLYSSDIKIGTLPQGASLAVFDAINIPTPSVDQRQPISNIRFDIDLTDMGALQPAAKQELLRFDG